MFKIITSRVTTKAVFRTVMSLGKLGLIATTSILANQTFREATNAFLESTLQDYRRIKFMMSEEA